MKHLNKLINYLESCLRNEMTENGYRSEDRGSYFLKKTLNYLILLRLFFHRVIITTRRTSKKIKKQITN